MKKITLVLGAVAVLASCGSEPTWDSYTEICEGAYKIFNTEEEAKTKCACEVEKLKASDMTPADAQDINNAAKISDITKDC